MILNMRCRINEDIKVIEERNILHILAPVNSFSVVLGLTASASQCWEDSTA